MIYMKEISFKCLPEADYFKKVTFVCMGSFVCGTLLNILFVRQLNIFFYRFRSPASGTS